MMTSGRLVIDGSCNSAQKDDVDDWANNIPESPSMSKCDGGKDSESPVLMSM